MAFIAYISPARGKYGRSSDCIGFVRERELVLDLFPFCSNQLAVSARVADAITNVQSAESRQTTIIVLCLFITLFSAVSLIT
ncbi:hypothetical protein J6590_033095 [Homalodisca vitripennis]|nr:hypothetical protein J6590_091233 [Homalodisca vitripennis]KAG8297567.1 hypothetical protein J6590_033095 [Homalodisca vitripennis]